MIENEDYSDPMALLIIGFIICSVAIAAAVIHHIATKRKKPCKHIHIYMDADNYVRCRDCQTHSNDFNL